MTKTEIKQQAQSDLLSAMQVAFSRVTAESEMTPADFAEYKKQLDVQMARVENFFGFEAYSFHRGV